MKKTITVFIHNARFRAYHGLYAEERKAGSEFEVDLAVSMDAPESITGLEETINYSTLFELLRTEMKKRRELLETFVIEFASVVHSTFQGVKKIDITITKLEAPIAKFSGRVGVRYSREY
jgi:7,8-dihydroneopterin aldolase/epimerase/oxygenase